MSKTIGILTSGGDAPGMNAAIRAVTRAAIKQGMKVKGIKRGYDGLLKGDMVDFSERTVSDIIQKGGTILYTARSAEFREQAGVLKGAAVAKENGLDGIVVIGGDGSFRGAADLSAAGIPCVGIPGTIDNDIACSEYTIGYDTAMNTAAKMVDKLRDTAQSHFRCSVVEVMGRNAGFIAVHTGIACGASAIITVEEKVEIEKVVEKINKTKATGKEHFIVIVSEGVGGSVEMAKYIEEKTGVETRATILGHVQRGGSPTVRDRVIATQMGYHAVSLLEQGIGNRVVAMKNNEIVDYDIHEALSMKKPFDSQLYKIADDTSF